jgi:hypothetical protein
MKARKRLCLAVAPCGSLIAIGIIDGEGT